LYRIAVSAARLRQGKAVSDSFYLDNDATALMLRRHLDRLSSLGGRPKPEYIVQGPDHLEAMATCERALLLTGHFPLNPVIHFHAHHLGLRTASVVSTDRSHTELMWGTGRVVAGIPNDAKCLIRVRGWLRNKGLVIAVVESRVPYKNGIEFSFGGTSLYLYPHMFELSQRLGIRLVFFAVRLERNGCMVIRFAKPSDASPGGIEHLMQECGRFLVEQSRK
jgi:hypothetical protein